jgi:hypothetical protein
LHALPATLGNDTLDYRPVSLRRFRSPPAKTKIGIWDPEGFLVLGRECLLVAEGQELPLRQ